ncbi:fungal-specific transcription factor domain-containing protein [Phaeosphaeria sp. MPI-PUGE-AT-0046c]|nr:fungal-specific transcription factor domain-containing protein [Phaeosphaeria sp. MPI-PUGE-AT-0046c]
MVHILFYTRTDKSTARTLPTDDRDDMMQGNIEQPVDSSPSHVSPDSIAHAYINALEERVAFLEARLPDHAEDHYGHDSNVAGAESTTDTGEPIIVNMNRSSVSSHDSRRESVPVNNEADDSTSLVDGVAYLSLCASGTTDKNHEPYYLGSSSGATIARVIQSSIFRSSKSRAPNHQSVNKTSERSAKQKSDGPQSGDVGRCEHAFPEFEQSRMLFDVFFERIHTRWPLLDREVYTDLFRKQYKQGALTIAERSILHLIYAITARFLSLTRKPCNVDYERQLSAATEYMDQVLGQHNLTTVQFLILLGVHGQRSPYGAGAWGQIRFATSVCIEMGLHRRRKPTKSREHERDTEMRRRVFWSCYCLDRITSIVLGRAFAIADRDINVELPSTSLDFWPLTHEETPGPSGNWSNIEPFVHIIKLYKIQSRIHKTVFRIDRDVFGGTPEDRAKLDCKMASLRSDLDEWVKTTPHSPKKENGITWMYDPESAFLDARDFYSVQYHKAVLFLFSVFLPALDTSDPRFITCTRSAACVCNAYKRLSHNETLTYTMISLHSCFVAGLTLVYCIWRDRSLFSYDVLEATRSCSQTLTIFGEKWPGAIKYRDIFDALSGSLLKLTIMSSSVTSHIDCSRGLRLDMTPGNMANSEPSPHQNVQERPIDTRTSMSHMVTDAVKEAFMEVDEEAPGGWQGWRIWNAMVRDEVETETFLAPSDAPFDQEQYDMDWNSHGGFRVHELDPLQDPTMYMGQSSTMDHTQWGFDSYK